MRFFVLLFSIYTLFSYGQTPSKAFNEFLKDEQVRNSLVSFKVVKNGSHTINPQYEEKASIVNYNADKLMYPASLQKLLTTKLALDVLGPNFKYETKVNFKGIIEDNIFKGVVEVIASGDPSLDENFVSEIYDFLVLKKIYKIEGYVVVVENVFDDNVPQSWLVEDVANYYGTAAQSFNYKKNLYKIKLKQAGFGEKPTLISTDPFQRKLVFENQLTSAEEDAPDKAYVIGMAFSNQRRIVGSIPSGTAFFTIKGSNNNPAQTFKNELIKKFQEKQFGFVFNEVVDAENTVLEMKHSSESLTELLKIINQKSNNLYAEAIFKTIGLKQFGTPGTTEKGIQVIAQKMETKPFQFYDGSGMSRKNLWSSGSLIVLLNDFSNNTSKVFQNSLGVSGVSGTMKYFTSDKLKGKVRGKSGSADGVLNYAGYYTDSHGDEYSFVFLINNYYGDRKVLRRKMVKVLEDLID